LLAIPYIKDGEIAEGNFINIPVNATVLNKLSGDDDDDDICIRCSGKMVHIGFKNYRCQQCGHEEKPEDLM
jgi:tRNA(Ile2) C34 agmatinyltransferase TiaS